jgi:hypothetical protein
MAGVLPAQTLINGSRVIQGSVNFCSDNGSTDSYACAMSPALTGYVTGACYTFRANSGNTGGASINLNNLGAKAITKAAGGVTTPLQDNDIRPGQLVNVCYDGVNMQMQSTLGNASAGVSGGGGGGGLASLSDLYANLIGTSCSGTNSGQIAIPTNSLYNLLRCNGATWDHFWHGTKVTPPTVTLLAGTVNNPVVTAVNGGLFMEGAAGSTFSVRGIYQSYPTPPFKVEVLVIPRWVIQNANAAGILLQDSVSGKLVTFGLHFTNNPALEINQWNTVSSWNSSANSTPGPDARGDLWLRIEDNGTNRLFSYSSDGSNWEQYFSHQRTTFITPDRLGIFVYNLNSNYKAGANFLHYQVR